MATNAKKTTRKPRQSTVPADETKAQKFVRLAETRIGKAIKMLRNIGKLGSPQYEREQAQVDKIVAALKSEVDAIGVKLKPGSKTEKTEVAFKLS